jgi:hypothetical protein
MNRTSQEIRMLVRSKDMLRADRVTVTVGMIWYYQQYEQQE